MIDAPSVRGDGVGNSRTNLHLSTGGARTIRTADHDRRPAGHRENFQRVAVGDRDGLRRKSIPRRHGQLPRPDVCAGPGAPPDPDTFPFFHLDLREPFRPKKFEEAAVQAGQQGAAVLIVDNFAHEHAGPGGMLITTKVSWRG